MTKYVFVAITFTQILLCSPLLADGTMEYKSSLFEQPFKITISGLKERNEMFMPILGEQHIITRVDKGVKWTVHPKKKTYSEEPIALPYKKAETAKSSKSEKHRKSKDEPNDCTPQLSKLSEIKTIAGIKSSGYELSCKESSKEKMTMWVGEETPASKKFMEEQQKFAIAHSKALFANYPSAERTDMTKGLDMMSGLVKGIPRMVKDSNFPKGIWTRFDMTSESGPVTLYELIKISANAVPSSQFEIPAGYRKLKEGENAVGMSDFVTDETKQDVKDGAKNEAAEAAKKEAMKSLLKGLGGLGR